MTRTLKELILVFCLTILIQGIPLAFAEEADTGPNQEDSVAPASIPENVQQMLNYKMKSEMLDRSVSSEYRKKIVKDSGKTYTTLWNVNKLDDTLEKSVVRAVNNARENESNWDKAKFLWSDETKERILDQILADTLTDFEPHYNGFMEEFSAGMEDIISTNAREFQNELFEGKGNLGLDIPGNEGLLKAAFEGARANFESEQQEKLDSLKKDFDTGISGIKVGTGAGAVTYLLLRKKIKQILVKKAGGVASRKLAGLLTGPVGWVIAITTIGYDIYDIGATIWEMPDRISENLYIALKRGYCEDVRNEIASVSGEAGEEQLKIFIRYAKEYDRIAERLAFDNCPPYTDLTANMTEAEQNQFAFTLYTVSDRANRDICWLVEKLGPEIKNMPSSEALCMTRLLACASPAKTARWVQLAPNELCRLTGSVPLSILCALEPNPTSLNAVNIISTLSAKAKNISASVNPQSLVWLVRNLPVHRVTVILNTPESIRKVEDTISALTQLAPVLREEMAGKLAGDYDLVRRVIIEGLPTGEQKQKAMLEDWELEKAGASVLLSSNFWIKAMKDPARFVKQLPLVALIFYIIVALLVLRIAWWILPRRRKEKQETPVREIPVKTKQDSIGDEDEKPASDNKP